LHLLLHSFPTRRSSDLPSPTAVASGAALLAAHCGCLLAQPAIHSLGAADPTAAENRRGQFHWERACPRLPLCPPAGIGQRFSCRDRKSTRLNSSHVSIS